MHIPANYPWPQAECLAQFRLTMTLEYQLSRQFVLDSYPVAEHTILFCKVSPHLCYCVLNYLIPIHQDVEGPYFPRPGTADSKSLRTRGLYRSFASCRNHAASSGSDHMTFGVSFYVTAATTSIIMSLCTARTIAETVHIQVKFVHVIYTSTKPCVLRSGGR